MGRCCASDAAALPLMVRMTDGIMLMSGMLIPGNVSKRLDSVLDNAAMLFFRLLSMSSITPPICAMLLRMENRTSFTLPVTCVANSQALVGCPLAKWSAQQRTLLRNPASPSISNTSLVTLRKSCTSGATVQSVTCAVFKVDTTLVVDVVGSSGTTRVSTIQTRCDEDYSCIVIHVASLAQAHTPAMSLSRSSAVRYLSSS